ncbi:MAG: NADH-quinone oxidoreductase subunit [Acidimicrobiaceae bacterium]|nr:NADH-quinone oxidoreductase subunit [Acidimicrobiaceae bacterium]
MDPLLKGDISWAVVLIVVLKAAVTFVVVLLSVLFMVWYERKIIAYMQNRVGPNRAGPFGILQSLADGIKLFFKEALTPTRADVTVFRLAPYLSMVPAFLAFSIVPIGGSVTLFGHRTILQLVDPPVGILFLLAVSSIAVYGVMLAGWSSGSKYPLLGAVRASAQMVSYEAALGLSVAAVVLVTGSLSTRAIIDDQRGPIWHWNMVRLGFVPFVIFLIAATAELNRPPFDLVEAEQELVGGFNTEYSSIGFALFYLAEFMNTVTMSAIIVTLFLGGPYGPNLHVWGLHQVSIVWFVIKVFAFLFTYVWLRATLPRLRYDQLMDLGWKRLIPISLGWLLVLAAMIVDRSYGIAVFAGAVVAGLLLARAVQVGQRATDEEAALHGPTRRLGRET